MLPEGFAVGHWTDREAWTGCTVVLAPPDAVAAAEVRGGGPGTRETDLLTPQASAPGVQAVLLTGGSAFGLAAAAGVVEWLAERDRGYRTASGHVVPLVPGAVVFDLPVGAAAHPGPAEGRAACEAGTAGDVARGSVGAGTGCSVGKFLGPEHATKGGLGLAATTLGDATIAALAVVNAAGEVLAEDGSVLAGAWDGGRYVRSVDALRAGIAPPAPTAREATTLACVMTDARLTKTEAWLVARAGSSGVARAVDPHATAVDGDVVFCLASAAQEAAALPVAAVAAHVLAAAVRDAVRQATGAPGVPAAAERPGSTPRAP